MFDKILTFFVPKNKIFFTLFTRSAQNLEATAKVFNELANTINPVRRVELVKQINDLEHVGDDITHEIFIILNLSFRCRCFRSCHTRTHLKINLVLWSSPLIPHCQRQSGSKGGAILQSLNLL